MTSALSTLKPCPFCNGAAEFSIGQTGDGKDWHYIECADCGSMGPSVNYADHGIRLKECLADAWNRRAALSTVPVEPVKPDDHVWVKCPNGHGTITHQHFDVCGCCPECGSVMVSAASPPGQEDTLAFNPCVIHYEDGNFSQMLLEDCATVTGWPHVVAEPLYRMQDRQLVGFQWHGKEPPATSGQASGDEALREENVSRELWRVGREHGWWQLPHETLSDFEHNDPIGHSEFMDIAAEITRAALSRNDGKEGRDG